MRAAPHLIDRQKQLLRFCKFFRSTMHTYFASCRHSRPVQKERLEANDCSLSDGAFAIDETSSENVFKVGGHASGSLSCRRTL